MTTVLAGLLLALLGLIIALAVANGIVFLLMHDVPWLRLLTLQRDVEVFHDIPYIAESDDRKHRLDLYRPKQSKRYPIVVFVHGGWWTSGDKDYYGAFTGLHANVGMALARAGVGVAVINYRLSPGVPFEAMLNDTARAVRWAQRRIADYHGDRSQLFLAGHDAGGHIAALLTTDKRILRDANVDTDDLRGCVTLSAPFDLEEMALNSDTSFNEHVTKPTFGLIPKTLRHWSPALHVRLGTPRMLLMTASGDAKYLKRQADEIAKKLEELHCKPKTAVIDGYSHADMVLKFGRKDDPVSQKMLAFIQSAGK